MKLKCISSLFSAKSDNCSKDALKSGVIINISIVRWPKKQIQLQTDEEWYSRLAYNGRGLLLRWNLKNVSPNVSRIMN